MKSLYIYKNDDLKLKISFELDHKCINKTERDEIALNYVNDLFDWNIAIINDLYLDDVLEIEETETNKFRLCNACQNSFNEDELNDDCLCEGCQLQDRE